MWYLVCGFEERMVEREKDTTPIFKELKSGTYGQAQNVVIFF